MEAAGPFSPPLVVVGGLNWGLVADREFELVATLVGLEFGETNAITASSTASSASRPSTSRRSCPS